MYKNPTIRMYTRASKNICIRCAKCAKCEIFGIFDTLNTIWPNLSDVSYLIFFATCYSRVTNLPRYRWVWHMDLLFFYSSFSLISLSISPSNPNSLLSLTPILIALPCQRWCQHWRWRWRLSLGSNLTTSWMPKTRSLVESSPQTKWVFHHHAH